MIDTSFIDQLNRFSLVIHKRVTSNYIGSRRSIAEGKGIVFKDHRIYSPGDDFRGIDWKVYARTDDLYIRNFEEERSLLTHVIIDKSKSMDFGKRIKKIEYASMLGIGFAYLAIKDNEKAMFATFSDKLDAFRPRRGMAQLAMFVDHLNNVKCDKDSKLLESVLQYKKFLNTRSVIIIISDFLLPVEEIKEALSHFTKHQVKLIQVLDPVEKELKLQGDFILKDSETFTKLRTLISPRLRKNYQSLLENHCAQIHSICNALQVDYYLLTTDIPIFDAFTQVLH